MDIFCPIGYTIDIISKKWALYVIRELNGGPKHFNQILNALEWGITPKILSKRLKELVKDKSIRRIRKGLYSKFNEIQVNLNEL